MPSDGASIGEVHVDVSARAIGFWASFQAQTGSQASKIGDILGQQISSPIVDAIAKGVQQGLERGTRGNPGRAPGRRTGDDFAGEFERVVKTRIEAALKALPNAKIGADASDADRTIADIRAKLEELRTKRIGVDLDAGEAVAQIAELEAELSQLGDRSPNVQVKVDTAAAAAKLAEITAAADAVAAESPTITVDADTGGAQAGLAAVGTEALSAGAGMSFLTAAGIGLGPAIIPAAAGAAAALGSLGAVAFAAGSAIGVAALAIAPVISAVKAMDAANSAAGSTAASAAGKQLQMAAAIDQVKSAQASLANARASAAAGERSASEQVATAERNLTAAQTAALTAQQAINNAREEARRSLEDLNNQVADNAIAQRRANLQLQDARTALANVNANPQATQRQRDDAQIAFDEASQQALELGQRQRELTADAAAANKAGIDGSKQVVAAKQQEVAAQQKVADAQRAVADARAAQDAQARQSAFAVAQAQQGVVNAQRAVQQASVSAGNEGSAATNKLGAAMAALSPAGQAFASFLLSLKPIFTDLSKAAQTGFLPGLQAGIEALLPFMPQITSFVGQLASAMGELARQALTALASPFWQNFFALMAATAIPLLQQMGPILLNLAQGFAGILEAFAPVAVQIGGFLLDLSAKFAAFGAGLSTSSGFAAFMAYVQANTPNLLRLISELATLAERLVIALAPIGATILSGLVAFVGWLNRLPIGVLQVALVAIGAIVLGLEALSVIIPIITAVTAAWGTITAIAAAALDALPIIAIIAGIAALVVGVIYAYNHFQTFHDVVNAVWAGIQTVIAVAWSIIKTVFDGINYYVANILAPVFLLLWHNVIEPVWQGIHLAIQVAWAAIQIVFGLIQIGLKILGAAFRELYDAVIRPVWDGLIRPLLQSVGDFFARNVVPAFQVGVDAIGRAWAGLREAARAPVAFVVTQVINPLIRGYNDLADAFHVNKVATIPGFAAGGYISGPGGPRDDAILARLSAGEYVIPARVVASIGVDYFDRLIGRNGSGTKYAGDGSAGIAFPGFADGGLVGFAKDVWSVFTDPAKLIKAPLNAAISRIPGAGVFTTLIGNMGHKLVDGLLSWIGGTGGTAPGTVGKAQAFLRSAVGHPYGWAMAGPGSWDCSGILSSVFNVLTGRNPYSHTFSTMNEAQFFPKPGFGGPLTAGWTNPGERGPGGNSVGHTAGVLAGVPFESTGGVGVRMGSGITPVTSFAHVGHYDSGGPLPPGLTIARNDTGKTEWVFTDEQTRALGGRGGGTTVNVHGSDGMSVHELTQAVMAEMAWQTR